MIETTTHITQQDMAHLRAFPSIRKVQILQHVERESATQAITYAGGNYYEKAILELRQEGYGLIDVQPMESAFSMIWYRRPDPLLGPARAGRVVMVLWEYEMQEDTDVTTLRTWKI